MPDFRRLAKNKKIANNSLIIKDKVKHFSLHKLHTEAFHLVPKPPLYILWYKQNFNSAVNAQ